MEKLETKYRETEKQKPLTMDFSSELARLMHKGTIPRKMPNTSALTSENHPPFGGEDRNFNRDNRAGKASTTPSFRFPELHFSQSIPKVRRLLTKTKRVQPFSGATLTENPAISTLKYAVSETRKIPGETIKVLDEFLYLPVWVTMPVIFAASVVLGAALSVFIAF